MTLRNSDRQVCSWRNASGKVLKRCGNQRELARAKNLKKGGAKKAGEQESNKGLSLEKRKARDAERMREKQQKKQPDSDDNVKQGVS